MTVSLNFRQAAFAQETGIFPIALIQIDHDTLEAPIRLSTDPTQRLLEGTPSNSVFTFTFAPPQPLILSAEPSYQPAEAVNDVVYGTRHKGGDYYFFPCSLKLPDDTDDGPGSMRMQFDNVHRDYVAAIRTIQGKPTVKVSIVMSNALDTIEQQWPEFLISDISYDAATITLMMDMETLTHEPYPYGAYTPGAFPGLFRGL